MTRRSALVVDDAKADRLMIGRLLESVQLEVTYAVDGREALSMLEAAPVDLVVTDLVMPELDGLELVREVDVRHPLIPVVIVTARGNEDLAVRALQAGAASYVPKSRLDQELVEIVVNVLSAAQQEQHRTKVMQSMKTCRASFVLGNDRHLFSPLVGYLQESVASLGLCNDSELTQLGVALEEALSNAAEHGNLELESSLREADRQAYDELAISRRTESPYASRRVHVCARISRGEAVFEIRDEGKGFDPDSLPDPTDPENLLRASGRGVMLMRTFMDEVRYDDTGRKVTMVKRRRE